MVDDRWVEVTPSQFPYEAEGLKIVRDLMPKAAPYCAWTNFEFRDDRGTWSEIDLLLLGPDGLHLIELKYYSGILRGDDNRWLRSGHPAQDSPLLLANRKAKRLRSKLTAAYAEVKRKNPQTSYPPTLDVIPYVHEAVFLHHPDFVCELPVPSRRDLYGLPGSTKSNLVGIDAILNGKPRAGTVIHDRVIAQLMQMIGVRAHAREAGSYVLDQTPLEDGPGWQDWLGTHKLLKDQRRRIRFYVAPEGASEADRRRSQLIAAHELKVMQRLSSDGILRPEDFVDSELGPGLVYPYDAGWQRLDLWLADNAHQLDFDAQLAFIRQLAETVQYAHGKNVVHRALNPRAILVRPAASGRLESQITGWQAVGRTDESTVTSTPGVTRLEVNELQLLPAAERGAVEAFSAPEGLLQSQNRLCLDVFSLGALAFYLVTGRTPAANRSDLAKRLHDQNGLDIWVDLPQTPSALRDAILKATRPQVSDRYEDVSAFLAALDLAVVPAEPDQRVDPLDAGPGATLDDRFTLLRRLGAGSTAVGLLVNDSHRSEPKEVVLKVAIDDSAAQRLTDEASALAKIDHPQVVKLLEGPIEVSGRQALLLESAGRESLAGRLGNRQRIPLDFLERWGTDLLEIVAGLDRAGVLHRDIKPANLGIREKRSAKHLALFDFSLAKASASDTHAGTPPYLDPFVARRTQYDSAAERYSAAVVLFEMATGHTPVFGDGMSDPSVLADEATISPDDFDGSVRDYLVPFFTRALARDASLRHHTADEMLREWQASFPASTQAPDDADALAAEALAETALPKSGLSPRALSVVEQLHVHTVGDLVRVDALRINNLPGITTDTRKELIARTKPWRAKFGSKTRGWQPIARRATFPDPHDSAEILLKAVRRRKKNSSSKEIGLTQRLLGLTGDLSANANQAEIAASWSPAITRGRVSQLLTELQACWADDSKALDLLQALQMITNRRLAELGDIATFDELADHLLSQLALPDSDEANEHRLAQGLLRFTIERQMALARVDANDDQEWTLRRRENQPVLLATRPELLDLTDALSRRADDLVGETNLSGTDQLIPASRVIQQLQAVVTHAEQSLTVPVAAELRDGLRLAKLGAQLSRNAGATATGDLHHMQLSAQAALKVALPPASTSRLFTTEEIRNLVAARFPMLARLPRRPRLDEVAAATGLLRWEEDLRKYRSTAKPAESDTDLHSRFSTILPTQVSAIGPGAVGQRLIDSRDHHSFVALGVMADRLDRFTEIACHTFDAVEVDLTNTMMEALREQSAKMGIAWNAVLNADASVSGSRAHQGLHALIARARPALSATIEQSLRDAEGRPVLLTDPSLLSRYDAIDLLAPLTDLSRKRPSALWLVLPQLPGNIGVVIDGKVLPLTAPSQYVDVGADWINAQLAEAVESSSS